MGRRREVVAVMVMTMMMAAQMSEGADDGGVEYVFSNLAESSAGGARFDAVVGQQGATEDMSGASSFINDALYDGSDTPRRPINKVTLSVDMDTSSDGFVAYTVGSGDATSTIHLSDKYVANFNEEGNPLEKEVKGILYHEMTHVWQWDGKGSAPSGFIEGLADYIRLTAGLAPPHWSQPGSGDRWDAGYDVTAYFLQYCESLKPGFVRAVNARLATSQWDVGVFHDLLGESVDQLWTLYKHKYGQ